MRAFRSVLASLFAVVALASLSSLVTMHRYLPKLNTSFYSWMAVLFLPICGGLYGIAAVAYFLKWRSARFWCLAVSALNLVVPFGMAYVLWHFAHEPVASTLWEHGLLLGIALATGIAFWRWNPATEKRLVQEESGAQAGDGTWSLLNHAYSVISAVIFVLLWGQWRIWGDHNSLPAVSFWSCLMQATAADLVVVVIHEAGHVLCGLAFGSRIRAFFAGPFQWQVYRGRWKFRFNPVALLAMGGGAGVVPTRVGEPKSFQIAMVAAGPVMSAITGFVGLWMAFAVPASAWQNQWFLLAMFATISLETAVLNLVPLRTAMGYSDGARILQLKRGGAWADLYETFRNAAATRVSAVRPRDYDIAAIHRVLDAGIVKDSKVFSLRLLAHSYYADREQLAQGMEELDEASALYDTCATKIPAGWHTTFVIEEATIRRDRVLARTWWDRMEAKNPTWLNGDYWMAKSALHWIEGDSEAAKAAWSKAAQYLAEMPQTGTYDFDRDVLARLAAMIQSPATANAAMA